MSALRAEASAGGSGRRNVLSSSRRRRPDRPKASRRIFRIRERLPALAARRYRRSWRGLLNALLRSFGPPMSSELSPDAIANVGPGNQREVGSFAEEMPIRVKS